jgi:O-antigen/teichoic acid export membrane protein
MRLALVAALAAGALLGVASIWGIPWIYGQAFAPATLALWILLPGAIALTPAGVASAYFAGVGQPHVNTAISAVALVATIAGDLLLIPRYGMLGAAATSTLSYAVTVALVLLIVRRRSGRDLVSLLRPSASDLRGVLLLAREAAMSTARQARP